MKRIGEIRGEVRLAKLVASWEWYDGFRVFSGSGVSGRLSSCEMIGWCWVGGDFGGGNVHDRILSL